MSATTLSLDPAGVVAPAAADGLEWVEIADAAYDRAYAGIRRAPLLQSRSYAAALCPGLGQTARRYRLASEGTPAGLVQLQEAGLLGGAIHALIVDRGPIFHDADRAPLLTTRFLDSLCTRFPARWGRRRRVIPEHAIESGVGDLSRLPRRRGYQTIWLDLDPDEAALRTGLKGAWRRDLAKGEAAGTAVHEDWVGDDLAALLDREAASRTSRGHAGPERKTLLSLARAFLPRGQMMILRTGPARAPLAAALFLLHGSSATYQVGWTGQAGRQARAGHLCLWRGVLALKRRGVRDLDLGGVNDATARGVKRFKEGLGGDLVTLPGQFR